MLHVYQFHVSAWGYLDSIDVVFGALHEQGMNSTPAAKLQLESPPYADGAVDFHGLKRAPWQEYDITVSGTFAAMTGGRMDTQLLPLHRALGQVGWLYAFVPRVAPLCSHEPGTCSCQVTRPDMWMRAPARLVSFDRSVDYGGAVDPRMIYAQKGIKFRLIRPWQQLDWRDYWGEVPRAATNSMDVGACRALLGEQTLYGPPEQIDMDRLPGMGELWTFIECEAEGPSQLPYPYAEWSNQWKARPTAEIITPSLEDFWAALPPLARFAFRGNSELTMGMRVTQQLGFGKTVTQEWTYDGVLMPDQVLRVGCGGLPAELVDYSGDEPVTTIVDLATQTSATPWEPGIGVTKLEFIGDAEVAYHLTWRCP